MIQTHTFNGIEGLTEVSGVSHNPHILLIEGTGFRAFHAAFHEALEASGFCDSCMHDKEGYPRTEDAARFLWRLGYRKK